MTLKLLLLCGLLVFLFGCWCFAPAYSLHCIYLFSMWNKIRTWTITESEIITFKTCEIRVRGGSVEIRNDIKIRYNLGYGMDLEKEITVRTNGPNSPFEGMNTLKIRIDSDNPHHIIPEIILERNALSDTEESLKKKYINKILLSIPFTIAGLSLPFVMYMLSGDKFWSTWIFCMVGMLCISFPIAYFSTDEVRSALKN